MSDQALKPTGTINNDQSMADPDHPHSLLLQLVVTDIDAVTELMLRSEGRERDLYALGALRIGLLSLRHARGQVDADAVRREGTKLLTDMNSTLEQYRTLLNENLTSTLKEYFDPSNGRFQERVDRLIKRDGELEQVLSRQIGTDNSELARTLAGHLGENSPLMKMLNPKEAEGFLQLLRQSMSDELDAERNAILSQFSLDNKDGALSRLISELTMESERLKSDLTNEVEVIVKEFSLDKEDSALSRLMRKVEAAQQTITKEFSLDDDSSALSRLSQVVETAKDAIDNHLTLDSDESSLSRLRRELVGILDRHEAQARLFQTDVTATLEAMKARKEESFRSTAHGNVFEDVVAKFVYSEAQKAGDIATLIGQTTGLIKYCKIGDVLVELGSECAASGEKIVVEAKEDQSYDLGTARLEIETARKNREATIGLFVFSKRTAPLDQQSLLRHGNDIFVVWDADDINSDVILKSALSLAKALCVRQASAHGADIADFKLIDAAIIEIETEARRLGNMKTWTETIQSSSGKILEEVRKMNDALERQIQVLKDGIASVKRSTSTPR